MATISFHPDQEDALAALSDDVGGLWCRRVAVLDSPPDSFTFLRDFVHASVPCVIKNAIPSCGASGVTAVGPMTLTLDEIINHVNQDEQITVDVTPDGHGDCVRSVVLEGNEQRAFVKPHERTMEIGKFRDILRRSSHCCDLDKTNNLDIGNTEVDGESPKHDSNGLEIFPLLRQSNCAETKAFQMEHFFHEVSHPPVVYYSRQNDCLRTELPKLSQLFPKTFPFAEQAFGTGPPDAINLWIGNERSVSSMHKDHYENLFYVCSGQKEFVLCPPADTVFLHEGEFISGTFIQMCDTMAAKNAHEDCSSQSPWVVIADDSSDINENVPHPNEAKVNWIEPDIKKYMENKTNYSAGEFPMLSKAHPTKVLVSEGEMLYIPSLWYHRVTQTCETVGVNYWYDMKFDNPHWCYFNFLQSLRKVERQGNGTSS